jgi:xylan 1,4-beta-xylosidase
MHDKYKRSEPVALVALMLILLLVCVGTFLGSTNIIAQFLAPADIMVDFGFEIQDQKSMNGFLHAVDHADPEHPPVSMIAPLRPRLWRVGDWNRYTRAVGSGAKVVFVLSDSYGYSTPPYDDYTHWEDHVRSTARSHPDKDIVWDVWNEPDIPDFWQGTREQFFETYRRAYVILREELGPDVLISGPSLSNFDLDYIAEFLDYCIANGCQVNALSWHELNSYRISPIETHLQYAHQNIRNSPAYSELNVREIHINEVVGDSVQYSPGATVGSLCYLERGQADYAAKACWIPLSGEPFGNCSNATLDGMLDPDTFQPRAVWWAHKIYADGVADRVTAQSTISNVVGIANNRFVAPNQRGQVLVGYFYEIGSSNVATRTVTVRLDNMSTLGFTEGEQVRVRLEKLPNALEQVVLSPTLVRDETLPVVGNSIYYTVTEVGLDEAFVLTVFSLKPYYPVYLPIVSKSMPSSSDHPFGVVAHLVYTPFYSPSTRDQALQLITDAGIQTVRMDMGWGWIEYEKDKYYWDHYDSVVQSIHAHHLDTLAILRITPQWASSSGWDTHPPDDPNDFANFVETAVERYDADGFKDAPGSPKVRYWQLWDEPNTPYLWSPEPNVVDYVALIQPAYAAAKRADPTAVVVLGGLAGNGVFGWPGVPENFLNDIYNNGGKDFFDVVAIHPFMHPDGGLLTLLAHIEQTRLVTEYYGDNKPIWITKIGWSTAPNAGGGRTVTDEEVAQWLAKVYSDEVLSRVGKVFWYNLRDYGTDPNDVEHHFGLVDYNMIPKAQYTEYVGLSK